MTAESVFAILSDGCSASTEPSTYQPWCRKEDKTEPEPLLQY
jgi:hypothetical protein